MRIVIFFHLKPDLSYAC